MFPGQPPAPTQAFLRLLKTLLPFPRNEHWPGMSSRARLLNDREASAADGLSAPAGRAPRLSRGGSQASPRRRAGALGPRREQGPPRTHATPPAAQRPTASGKPVRRLPGSGGREERREPGLAGAATRCKSAEQRGERPGSAGTHGVQRSLYSLAIVSIPPLRATPI